MTEAKKREGEFDLACIGDLRDELLQHNLALRALDALLLAADHSCFTEECYGEDHKNEASNLRWGLSQLIQLYLDRQENIISGYADQYFQGDIYLLKRAADTIDIFKQGAFQTGAGAVTNFRERITDLDLVINNHGELEEKALQLKDIYLKYIEEITGKENLKEKGGKVK